MKLAAGLCLQIGYAIVEVDPIERKKKVFIQILEHVYNVIILEAVPLCHYSVEFTWDGMYAGYDHVAIFCSFRMVSFPTDHALANNVVTRV